MYIYIYINDITYVRKITMYAYVVESSFSSILCPPSHEIIFTLEHKNTRQRPHTLNDKIFGNERGQMDRRISLVHSGVDRLLTRFCRMKEGSP